MIDFAKLFTESWEFWKNNWQKLIVPFIAVLAVSIVMAITSFVMQFVLGFIVSIVELANPVVGLVGRLAIEILGILFTLTAMGVAAVIAFSIWKPLWDVMNKQEPSDFMQQIKETWWKALLIYASRVLILGIPAIFLIFGVTVVLVLTFVVGANRDFRLIAMIFGILIMLVCVGLTMIVSAVLRLLLSFWEMEVAVGGKGVIEGLQASVKLVTGNLVDVVMLGLAWWAIGLVVEIASLIALVCTLCMAMPLIWLIRPLVIAPLQMVTFLRLWKELGGSAADEVTEIKL